MRWPLRHPRFIPPHENRPGHVPGSGDGSASGSQPLIERILLHPLVHSVDDTGGGHDRPEAVGSRTCGEGACKSLHAGHHPSAGAPHGRRWLMVAGPPFSTSTYRTISAVAEDASRASVGHAMIQRPSPQSRSVDSETRSTTWEQATSLQSHLFAYESTPLDGREIHERRLGEPQQPSARPWPPQMESVADLVINRHVGRCERKQPVMEGGVSDKERLAVRRDPLDPALDKSLVNADAAADRHSLRLEPASGR